MRREKKGPSVLTPGLVGVSIEETSSMSKLPPGKANMRGSRPQFNMTTNQAKIKRHKRHLKVIGGLCGLKNDQSCPA